jgi:hypothetical protein
MKKRQTGAEAAVPDTAVASVACGNFRLAKIDRTNGIAWRVYGASASFHFET